MRIGIKEMRIPGKYAIIFYTLLGVVLNAYSQQQFNVWCFGNKAGLNFNTTPPTAFKSAIAQEEGNATISDNEGNLLFYTNGIRIWNKNHLVMPNGLDLSGGQSSSQSAIITPYIGNTSRYFVFTTDGSTATNSKGPKGQWDGLVYSIVDMSLDNGNGDILPDWKNKELVDSVREQVVAVMHANNKDYWVITKEHFNNRFYAFLVNCNGVDAAHPVISDAGTTKTGYTCAGILRASKDGKTLVSSYGQPTINGAPHTNNKTEMFDFDNLTGEIGNARTILDATENYGVCFSPNDSIIYVGGSKFEGLGGGIYQIPLHGFKRYATNVSASMVTYNYTVAVPAGSFYAMGALQQGPDNKIYISNNASSSSSVPITSLSILNDPDNFNNPDFQFAVTDLQGNETTIGLPDFFNYTGIPDTVKADFKYNSFCFGDSTQFFDLSYSNIAIWQWNFNYPSTDLSDKSSDNNPSHTYTSPGTYTVQLTSTNANQCSDTTYGIVFVKELKIDAGTDGYACADDSAKMLATGGSTDNYMWSPSEGLSCSNCANPKIKTASTTQYTVVYTDPEGCTAVDYTNVYVCEPQYLYAPNTFTPNGDGINDVFYVYSSEYNYFEIKIFDRWGNVVFNSNNAQKGWTGYIQSSQEPAPQSSYAYLITISDDKNNNQQIRGCINLIR